MSTWLYRIGRFADRRRFWVIGAWLILAVTAVGINRVGGGGTVDNFEVPGVESQAAIDLLKARFPERAGATAMLVFHVSDGVVTDPKNAAGIEQTMAEVRSLDHVLTATDPLTGPMSKSPDGATAFAAVQYDRSTADLGHPAVEALTKTATPATTAGVQVEFGGELPTVLKERTTGPAEMIGMIAALIILFVTFRSVIASVMPLGAAVAGLVVGLSLVGLLGAWINIPSVAPRLGTMIGLGVGIDYALFILSRHRDNLDAGLSNSESIGQTNATAGEAVVVAGGTVVVAILGLQLAGIPFVAALGYSASLVVAVAVAVAITLLPAVLGVVGRRVLPRSHRQVEVRRPVGTKPVDTTGTDGTHSGWVRWAHWVAYHPWRSAITATFVLLLLAVPMLDMRLGQADALVLDRIATAIRNDSGVRVASPASVNEAGDTALITAIPTTKPQDQATSGLVHRLRRTTLPTATAGTDAKALVGGPTAGFIDQSDKISARLPWFILAVVSLSFLLLMAVFRSVLVPLKAALLNLLSIGAAYGVVVAVFQWGWGRSLIGLDEAVPIASFVPMMMFAILFGLSMDYEVFILSRIREEYHGGHSNIDSVVEGLGATAKVISAAALIMISVFLGFVAGDDPVVKMMGVGLATAVAVDATIVRMVLVPATMTLVGDANWWLPKWLDRLLPRLELDRPPSHEATD